MKRSKFSDSQIIAILKQAESGTPVSELCREHGMSDATFYNWRSKYGGMDVQSPHKSHEALRVVFAQLVFLYSKQFWSGFYR